MSAVSKTWSFVSLLVMAFIMGIGTERSTGSVATAVAGVTWLLFSFGCLMFYIGQSSRK